MKRVFEPGFSKRSLLIAVAVGGLLSASILGVNAVRSAEPSVDAAAHGFEGRVMDRCARLADHLSHMDKKLTADQIRDVIAGRLVESGEGTLKVGKVTTKDPGVVAVEIVTNSGSLVTTREISTKTGLPANLEKRCEEYAARMAAVDGADRGGEMHEHGGMHEHEGMHGHGGMMGGFSTLAMMGERGRDLNLSADQVKKLADASLILTGNPRLKVGTVKEKDNDTIAVDIVTVDNALVLHREVDRHTGRVHRAA